MDQPFFRAASLRPQARAPEEAHEPRSAFSSDSEGGEGAASTRPTAASATTLPGSGPDSAEEPSDLALRRFNSPPAWRPMGTDQSSSPAFAAARPAGSSSALHGPQPQRLSGPHLGSELGHALHQFKVPGAWWSSLGDSPISRLGLSSLRPLSPADRLLPPLSQPRPASASDSESSGSHYNTTPASSNRAPYEYIDEEDESSEFDRSAARQAAHDVSTLLSNGATARQVANYLLPLNSEMPAVRLSNVFARGGFSEVRFGIDEDGRQSVWRSVRLETAGRHRGETPAEQVVTEIASMADIGSPLMPLRMYLTPDNRFVTEIPVFSADLHDLLPAFVPVRRNLEVPADTTKTAVAAAIRVGKDIAAQLVTMHGRGWIHRDIKPENLLYSTGRGSVLADFGLTASVGSGEFVDGRAGTPWYMAHEVVDGFDGTPYSTYASDLFSLGLSLVELATGGRLDELPFLQGDIIDRYLGLGDLNLESTRPDTTESGHKLDTSAKLYKYLAQGNREFANHLFNRWLSPWHRDRGTAAQMLSALQAMQPDGSNEDVAATTLMHRAARVFQAEASASRNSDDNFAALRQMPATPEDADRIEILAPQETA